MLLTKSWLSWNGWVKMKAVITQNIDGLHQLAGSSVVYELHGSVHRNHCMKCRTFYDAGFVGEYWGAPVSGVWRDRQTGRGAL